MEITQSTITKYSTKDMKLAAFLWTQAGVTLSALNMSENTPSTVFFVFDLPMSEDEVHRLTLAYQNEETLVEPNRYNSKMNALRDRLNSAVGIVRGPKRA